MTADNPITELLAAPLSPDWTIERLAEKLLGAIAARHLGAGQEFILDADTTTDSQSRRLLRPLLACLATKSAAETGTPPNLYGGHLSFKRSGPEGAVWILGEFENRPGDVRVALRRSTSSSEISEGRTGQPQGLAGADRQPDVTQSKESLHGELGNGRKTDCQS
jgi:hypothetical protein